MDEDDTGKPVVAEDAVVSGGPVDAGNAVVAGDPVVSGNPVVAEDAAVPQPDEHPLVRDLMRHPYRWRIWPALAVLRWLQRLKPTTPRLVFRSHPSQSFAGSEVREVILDENRLCLVLNAPGLATAGSPLPASDIARIIADYHEGGALSAWLDGPGDRFMHLLEEAQRKSNAAYALLAGGGVEAFALTRDLIGRSTPLVTGPDHTLQAANDEEPEGAIALAGLFLGPVSASGLRALFFAYTGLPVRVEEFAGAQIATARPARMGSPMGLMLGASCELPAAAVEVHIEGGGREGAREWAHAETRRRSLHRLATAYVGAPSPEVRLFLWLDGNNVPPAALGNGTALGGLAVLGTSDVPVRLPLAHGTFRRETSGTEIPGDHEGASPIPKRSRPLVSDGFVDHFAAARQHAAGNDLVGGV